MTGLGDLLNDLRAAARACGDPQPAADGLPAGFQHVDDVIVLLQPLRPFAEDNAEENQEALLATLQRLAEKNFFTGTRLVAEGGIWAALLCGCAGRGFHAELSEDEGASAAEALLSPRSASALVSARPKAHVPLANFVERGGQFTAEAIGRVTASAVRVRWMDETIVNAASLDDLRR